MKNAVILIGVGEIGGVFAKGILKTGYPVYPVARGTNLEDVMRDVPDPKAVVITVGEKDFQNVLKAIPRQWHDRLVFVQNELLPRDWIAHKIENPTVVSIWFEKKPGQDPKVIIPSPVFGPQSEFIQTALASINIDCHVLLSEDDLLFELVLKNVYILTVNIAGLEVGGTVGELWSKHQAFARDVADNIMDIQFHLTEQVMDRTKLISGMVKAFNGDLNHKCMGRSAPDRLKRAIAQADQFNLSIAKLREIYHNQKKHHVKF